MSQDIFMKLTGINGESQDATHKHEIEVLDWEWEVTQASSMHSGTGGGAGKATVHDFSFDHYVDRASPNLMQHCLTGKHIETATLVVRKAGEKPLEFLKIAMDDVIVTQVALSLKTTMRQARETVSLSFARVKQEYTIQNQQGGSGGTVSMSFDIQKNTEK
ncbi:type VI secretion system tube protein Hcp [Variovorax sp. J22P271]|uniref:Hcp family type VI secretion system effector n=1 Tax=Variovorax davisae TaxID=3053515 RepID=UPI0025763C7D|nr:type VI secretion system tube protein Hcp [Variovorax sp. J22P271]MDM0031473.1 type VI secretion system tube protein Hcp [Variovorax sp. J22P271]